MAEDQKIPLVVTDSGQSDVPEDQQSQSSASSLHQDQLLPDPHAEAARLQVLQQPENIPEAEEIELRDLVPNPPRNPEAAADAIEACSGPISPTSTHDSGATDYGEVFNTSSGSEEFLKIRCNIIREQFTANIPVFITLIVIDLILAGTWGRADRQNGDIYASFILTSSICFLVSIVFKRAQFMIGFIKFLEEGPCRYCRKVCPCCGKDKDSEFDRIKFVKQSQYSSAKEDTHFEEVAAGPSGIDPRQQPSTSQRHRGRPRDRSPDRTPKPPVEIKVDVEVHGDAPPDYSGGACGYDPDAGGSRDS